MLPHSDDRAGASGPAGPVLAGPIFCRKVDVSNSWPYVSAMVNCEQLLYIAIVTMAVSTLRLGSVSNLPDIPDSPHQPGPGFKFPKRSFGKATVVSNLHMHCHLKDCLIDFGPAS